jgi:hypothetical protein
MNLSADLTRYLTWTAVVVAGALLALIDLRRIGRPAFGALLVAGAVAGLIVT